MKVKSQRIIDYEHVLSLTPREYSEILNYINTTKRKGQRPMTRIKAVTFAIGIFDDDTTRDTEHFNIIMKPEKGIER